MYRKEKIYWFVLAIVGASVLLLSAEALLRLFNFTLGIREMNPEVARILEEDAQLGWRLRDGRYEFQSLNPQRESKVVYTLDPKFGRATGKPIQSDDPSIVFFGGSYVLGQGLCDDETMAWQVSEQLADKNVFNFAVSGYGTYQAIDHVKAQLKNVARPQLVVYGFMEDHEGRNVASSDWVEDLINNTVSERIRLPYVILNSEGTLEQRETYVHKGSRLLVIDFLRKLTYRFRTVRRETQKLAVTHKLLLDFHRELEEQNISFAVMILDAKEQKTHLYEHFFKSAGITYIPCAQLTPERKIPVDGHPDAVLNAEWARCLGEFVGEMDFRE